MFKPGLINRIPRKFFEGLDKISRETGLPVIYHLKKAISNYIEDYKDFELAMRRRKNITNEKISTREFKKRYNV